MTSSYLVNEMYPCLQGEGPQLGTPSLLLRFQICNLRCSWCDTPYTHTFKSDLVDKNNPKLGQKFKRFSLENLLKTIQAFPQKHIILTGGEPTLQNIGKIMRELKQINSAYSFEVETNGTRIPHKECTGFLESDYELAQWNISPKFSNANETIVKNALEHWSKISKINHQTFFKFVIRKTNFNEDFLEIINIIQEFKIEHQRVILMPEGVDVDSQIHNIELHNACLKYGFRYTPRLHLLIFGNKRGT